MIIKDIYCYYEELGNVQEPPLVEYWKERWKLEGWTPVVLGIEEARRDPRFQAISDKHDRNPHLPMHHEFGKANFRRWLAFSQIDGAICDYDVIPIKPFPPQEFAGFISGSPTGGPGFIAGKGADFSQFADRLLAYEAEPGDSWQGVAHVSDMRILHKNKSQLDGVLDICGCYSDPGWRERPLCHFANHYLVPYSEESRLSKIQRIVNEAYPRQA